jgi:diketogulonate reductase-like aldo/keto reductase
MSLVKLRTDYVDLLLLHWPTASPPSPALVGALGAVAKAGKTRHIGLSNFNSAQMLQATRLSAAPLVTNQIEYHPYLDQSILLDAARRSGISITAYCGMAIGRVFTDGVLAAIAGRHRRSIAQIVLRWLVSAGRRRGAFAHDEYCPGI